MGIFISLVIPSNPYSYCKATFSKGSADGRAGDSHIWDKPWMGNSSGSSEGSHLHRTVNKSYGWVVSIQRYCPNSTLSALGTTYLNPSGSLTCWGPQHSPQDLTAMTDFQRWLLLFVHTHT